MDQTVKNIEEEKSLEIVSNWLEKCNKEKVLPWEYDLKQEIYYKFNKEDHPVKRFLDARAGNYFSQRYRHRYPNENIEIEDCELMQSIYYLLWGTYTKKSEKMGYEEIEADIMNSFFSPYKKKLNKKRLGTWQAERYKEENQKIEENEEKSKLYGAYVANQAGDFQELLSHFNDMGYRDVNEEFKDFAKFTHTIGNCTLVPLGFNVGQRRKKIDMKVHNDNNRTWSQALIGIGEGKDGKERLKLLLEKTSANINEISEATSYLELYKNRFFMDYYYPEIYAYKYSEYLEKVVKAIESRGQKIIWEICKKIEGISKKEYTFYKNLQSLPGFEVKSSTLDE